jgi:hypothetical protein
MVCSFNLKFIFPVEETSEQLISPDNFYKKWLYSNVMRAFFISRQKREIHEILLDKLADPEDKHDQMLKINYMEFPRSVFKVL